MTFCVHYNDIIMSSMASQITSLTIVYSTIYSRRRSKKTSKLHVTGLCAGNSPMTGEFPAQMASNMENISIWWRHHAQSVPPVVRKQSVKWPFWVVSNVLKCSIWDIPDFCTTGALTNTPLPILWDVSLYNGCQCNGTTFFFNLLRLSDASVI